MIRSLFRRRPPVVDSLIPAALVAEREVIVAEMREVAEQLLQQSIEAAECADGAGSVANFGLQVAFQARADATIHAHIAVQQLIAEQEL